MLVVVALLGSLAGPRGLRPAAGYCLGLPGGLWGALAMWRVRALGRAPSLGALDRGHGHGGVHHDGVRGACCGLVPSGGVAEPGVVARVDSHPVQLLAMGFSVPFVVGLWYYYRSLLRQEHPGLEDRRGRLLELGTVVVFFVLVAGGLAVADVADRHAEQGARDALLGRALLAAGGINPTGSQPDCYVGRRWDRRLRSASCASSSRS